MRKLVLAAVLLFVGGAVFVYDSLRVPVEAQVGARNIYSEWIASRSLWVHSGENRRVGGRTVLTEDFRFPIGVAEWRNVIRENNAAGRILYEETWTILPPDRDRLFSDHIGLIDGNRSIDNAIFTVAERDGQLRWQHRFGTSGTGTGEADLNWLSNYFYWTVGSSWWQAQKYFTFSVQPEPNDTTNTNRNFRVGREPFRFIGNASRCVTHWGNALCMFATGAYGFMKVGELGDGHGERPEAFGAMIPKRWFVTGTVR